MESVVLGVSPVMKDEVLTIFGVAAISAFIYQRSKLCPHFLVFCLVVGLLVSVPQSDLLVLIETVLVIAM